MRRACTPWGIDRGDRSRGAWRKAVALHRVREAKRSWCSRTCQARAVTRQQRITKRISRSTKSRGARHPRPFYDLLGGDRRGAHVSAGCAFVNAAAEGAAGDAAGENKIRQSCASIRGRGTRGVFTDSREGARPRLRRSAWGGSSRSCTRGRSSASSIEGAMRASCARHGRAAEILLEGASKKEEEGAHGKK